MAKKFIKIIFTNFIIILILFAISDFSYSKFFFKNEIYPNIYEKDKKLHHRLKKNFKGISKYGHLEPIVCTNDFGLKDKCNSKTPQKYNIGVIGDSIIQGVGLSYDQTLVGILNQNNSLSFANLGTGSYSPLIYFHRLKELIKSDFLFDHIIVFIDISDIQDETLYSFQNGIITHKFDEIGVYETEEIQKSQNTNIISKLRNFVFNNFKLTFSTISIIKRKFFLFDPYKVFPNNIPRYTWTFNNKLKDFHPDEIKTGIENAKKNMDRIYKLLNENQIKFSIAVYPLPAQLLYDVEKNLQSIIWKEFCANKCYKFFDFNRIFYEKKNSMNEKEFYKKYFITYDDHFNYYGNKLIAEEFINILNNN